MEKGIFLAKSEPKETLVDHSVKTLNTAVKLIEKSGIEDECLQDIILISSAFHDIGKCTENFQRHIQDGVPDPLWHNVISFRIIDALVDIKLKDSEKGISVSDMKNVIMKSVLFHHPIPDNIEKSVYNESLFSIAGIDEDNDGRFIYETIEKLSCILNPMLKQCVVSIKEYDEYNYSNDFTYFSSRFKINGYLNVCNGIVRFADIIASGGCTIEEYTDFSFNKDEIEFVKPKFYDDRFYKHLECAKLMSENTISDLFGPTGFGKTIISVIWSIMCGKKVYYVSPTNVIARSNYESIIKECNALGLGDVVKVGLLLTNKWEFGGDLKDKNDIIVTNIDNYVRPLFKCDGRKPMCFGFNYCDVIFDEYQQYASEAALLALFEMALYGRSLCKSSKTILMSATPNEQIYRATNVSVDKVRVDFSEYGSKKIKFEFRDYNPEKDTDNFIMVVNAIKTSQKKSHSDWINYHSQFTSSDKNKKCFELNEHHGKESNADSRKKPVCSTNIISTGVDISFEKIIACGLPLFENTQIIGRGNRWGEYPEGCVVVISKGFNNEGSEKKAIECKYDEKLRNLEYDLLRKKVGDRTITMNEYYEIVDEIKSDREHERLFKEYIKRLRNESYKNLSKLSYTYSTCKESDESIISTLPTIRSTSEVSDLVSIFVTLKGMDGCVQMDISEKELLNHNLDYMYNMVKGDKKYGNHDKLYRSTRKSAMTELNDIYIRLARHSSTPYVLDDKIYFYSPNTGGPQKYDSK